jgi:hypothetical protein
MSSSLSRKAIIDDSAIRTFFQGFLGATTFGAYNYYIVYEPMKQISLEQKKLIDDQRKMIERLETKLNNRWWW